MLPDTLNTNEVRDATGAEVEFERKSSADNKTIFAKVGEAPSAPYRITVSHSISGKGLNRVRRSLFRVDKTVVSQVDSVTPVTVSAYQNVIVPEGHLTSLTEVKNVLANCMSGVAITGVDSVVQYDCTGNGSAALVNATL